MGECTPFSLGVKKKPENYFGFLNMNFNNSIPQLWLLQ
jgi:hypothetical protein